MIHVFIGTKAQYIKTAPLLRLLDERGVPYRLIDSGQHADLSRGMRTDLGVREPDVVLGGSANVSSIPAAIRWALTIAARLWSRRRVRREIFDNQGGVCVVHGDTPSTLLAALLARRAGLTVAHMEAGLRSRSIWHPFPEELIRIITMRISGLLFAPDQTAVDNLRAMKVRGEVVLLPANTSIEAVAYALRDAPSVEQGRVLMTMHRVENLHNKGRLDGFVALVERVAAAHPVTVVMHEPTLAAMEKSTARARLDAAGVEVTGLVAHQQFLAMVRAAPFVVTDGGSVQEECAALGVPTLLWRARTERPDGLGANVVLADYNAAVVDAFLAGYEDLRSDAVDASAVPSEVILARLLDD